MIEESRCSKRRCLHYVGVRRTDPDEESTERHVCRAFPDSIPVEIAFGPNLHLEPFRDDSGIVYEEATQEEFDSRDAQEDQ